MIFGDMVMSGQNKKVAVLLFLIGLFSQTQVHVVGSIGISELVIFLVAPWLFYVNYRKLKHDGFLWFIWLSILVCLGCVVSSVYNSTPFILAAKGFATPYSIFAITVVLHGLLRKDLNSLKWLFVGIFGSLILSVFIFQPETYTVTSSGISTGSAAIAMMISYPLFWAIRITALVSLPIKCMYLKTPILYSIVMTLGAGVFSVLFSDSSGRATAMIAIFATLLLWLGGRSQKKIFYLGKIFPAVILVMTLIGVCGKIGYSYAAKNGLLGDKAIDKYENQTFRGEGILHLLMAGRKEFFVGIIAALDKPILGHGPSPEDKDGYLTSYLLKYGNDDECENLMKERRALAEMGFSYFTIPTHSFIASFWVYYGIIGLIFWINALILIWKYFRIYASAIPQWFGYLAVFLPTMVWGTFFAPFGDRIGCTLPLVCILFVKAVCEHRISLPYNMQMELTKHR